MLQLLRPVFLPVFPRPQRRPLVPRGSGKVLVLVALMALLCGCQKSSHEQLVEARSSLASGSYDDALTAADAGLQGKPSKVDAWGLELVKLEAYARSGNGDGAKQHLAKLATRYAKRLSPTDYSSTAQQLQAAGQGAAAIEVLDVGKKRYPDNDLIEKMISEAMTAESSPEELDMLRSLGYIE